MTYGTAAVLLGVCTCGNLNWSLRQLCLHHRSPVRTLDSAPQAGFSGQKDFACVTALHCWGSGTVWVYGRYVLTWWETARQFSTGLCLYSPSWKAWENMLFCILVNTWYCRFNCSHSGVCSLSGSSIDGIFQARILEWVAIAFCRRSFWPRDWTQVSFIVGRRFTVWATRE